MPFCTQCGQQANGTDLFCAYCGARQASAAGGTSPGTGTAGNSTGSPGRPFGAAADPLSGLTPRTASILCYIPTIGWIPAVIVLAARKFRGDHVVRFHAFQGLYLFAAWLVVTWVIRPLSLAMPDHFFRIHPVLEALLLGVSIFMMVKASHDETYVLPIIGELAQRSATEH
jgi:uncharacterized membrane protein